VIRIEVPWKLIRIDTNEDNVPVTTSLNVAEVFGKEHKNVLRDIQQLECSQEFAKLNFELCYRFVNNRSQPYYQMTRDGFTFLAMGFTGKKAAEFKEAYIHEFNRMEEHFFMPIV